MKEKSLNKRISEDFLKENSKRFIPQEYDSMGRVIKEATDEKILFDEIEEELALKYNLDKKTINNILKIPIREL